MSTVQERRDELSVIASDLDKIARRLAVLGHEAHLQEHYRETYWIDHARADLQLALAKIEKLGLPVLP